ncbi:hypothetical protein F4781DRAFT_149811 [Annulohypoxylon bovei var. microspora]|nr:hypothetical protein F4781DRAFT_149811 [Annulohypoxylon bovei var. microspora]
MILAYQLVALLGDLLFVSSTDSIGDLVYEFSALRTNYRYLAYLHVHCIPPLTSGTTADVLTGYYGNYGAIKLVLI